MSKLVILLAAISILASALATTGCVQQPTNTRGQTYTAADVDGAYEKAMQLREEGKFQQALDLHIWYHENALKYDEAQTGVRLSFMLMDWAELGQVYPPALLALRSERNGALATYEKDPSDSLKFGEVMSIDLALDDWRSAKSLFYLGRKNGVQDDTILRLELNKILQTGDMKWAGDVIGDPTAALDEIKRDRDMTLSSLKGRKGIRGSMDEMFATQVANLVKVVAKVHGLPAARKIQRKALMFLDSPSIQNALPKVEP